MEKEPEYQAAKGGDWGAALAMAERLVRPETVDAIRAMVGDQSAKIVPVLARESAGNNKIPLAAAEVLGDRLGLEVEYNIVQAEKVGRTNKGADHRLAMNDYWRNEFGYPIEQLTQGEAGHLRAAPTVDAIRDRITAARESAGWTVDERTTGEAAAESPSVKRGPHQEKAEAFKQLSSKDLLEQYPNDKAIEEAVAVQAVAGKFALEQIPDPDNRARFLENVRDRIADNLEHGRENTAPRILESRDQGNDLER